MRRISRLPKFAGKRDIEDIGTSTVAHQEE